MLLIRMKRQDVTAVAREMSWPIIAFVPRGDSIWVSVHYDHLAKPPKFEPFQDVSPRS
jgi:hypothetical protein